MKICISYKETKEKNLDSILTRWKEITSKDLRMLADRMDENNIINLELNYDEEDIYATFCREETLEEKSEREETERKNLESRKNFAIKQIKDLGITAKEIFG